MYSRDVVGSDLLRGAHDRKKYAMDRRPQVRGKFLFIGEQKFYPCGVTYGPFRPDAGGCAYHTAQVVQRDFAAMAAAGINSVRTYTAPPRGCWMRPPNRDFG